MSRRGWLRVWAFVALLTAVLVFAAWASDFITMQGERTVYTVDCKQGEWKNDTCSGALGAGLRYRYRALRPHREVIFWTLGTSDRSGKFEDCDIVDGRNWICRPNVDTPRSITMQMAQGEPVPHAATKPFRAVSKWRWLLLDKGLTSSSTAGMGGTLHASASAPAAPSPAASTSH